MTTSRGLVEKAEADAGERFRKDTTEHKMTVLHDDGLYRHLRFRNPAQGAYWFDLITWPGCLTIRGDLGESYTFARLADMFEFFRAKRINPHYWSEKLEGGRSSVKEYSQALMKQLVVEYFVECARDGGGVPAGLGKAIRRQILNLDLYDEDEARAVLENFEFGGTYEASCACGVRASFLDEDEASLWRSFHTCGRRPEIRHTEGWSFGEIWEWSFSDYTWQFLWACHAIIWGIRQYDAAKVVAPAPALDAAAAVEVPVEAPAAELVTQ